MSAHQRRDPLRNGQRCQLQLLTANHDAATSANLHIRCLRLLSYTNVSDSMPGAHVLTIAKRALQTKISLCCTATAKTTSACYTRLTVSLGKVDCTTAPQHVAPSNGTAISCTRYCTCHLHMSLFYNTPRWPCQAKLLLSVLHRPMCYKRCYSCRYQTLWMPFLTAAKQENLDMSRLVPPIDIAWAWHVSGSTVAADLF